jgi:RHS repeat-associated protein
MEPTQAALTAGVPRQKVAYTYDGQSRRIQRQTYTWDPAQNNNQGGWAAEDSTLYLYQDWTLLAEYKLQNSSYTLHKTYLWSLDLANSLTATGQVGALYAQITHSPLPLGEGQGEGVQSTYALLPGYDANGNIVTLIDADTVQVAATYDYDAFGRQIERVIHNSSFEILNSFTHGFSTKPLDPLTNLHYYGYRFYSADMGRWLNRDPIGERGGQNIYSAGLNNLLLSLDIYGLATEQQYQELMTKAWQAMQRAAKAGSADQWNQRGKIGEMVLERLFERGGWKIIKGPANNPGSIHHADVIAFKQTDTGCELMFMDNKVKNKVANVGPGLVDNLTVDRQSSIDEAIRLIQGSNFDDATKQAMLRTARAAADDPSLARWLVANATAAEIENGVKGITNSLARQGVGFGDIFDDNFRRSLGLPPIGDLGLTPEALEKARGKWSKLSKSLPVIGWAATGATATIRLKKAWEEDLWFEMMCRELDPGKEPIFLNMSTARESFIIIGGEVGSEAAGIGLAAGLSWLGPFGILGGYIVGGYIGGEIGEAGAADFFDATAPEYKPSLDSEPYPIPMPVFPLPN